MTLIFPYKCLICKLRFESADESPRCPHCRHGYVEKLSRKGKKITKKKIKFSGDFVEIGKKCQKCIFSEKSTSLGVKIKCNFPEPETVFHKNQGWICYSYQKMKGCKNDEKKRCIH